MVTRPGTFTKTVKKQNFLPRELLLFLGLENELIEQHLEAQRVSHPSVTAQMALAPISDRLPDQYYADENFKETVNEGVKELLTNVVSKQEYF